MQMPKKFNLVRRLFFLWEDMGYKYNQPKSDSWACLHSYTVHRTTTDNTPPGTFKQGYLPTPLLPQGEGGLTCLLECICRKLVGSIVSTDTASFTMKLVLFIMPWHRGRFWQTLLYTSGTLWCYAREGWSAILQHCVNNVTWSKESSVVKICNSCIHQ